MVFLVSTPTAAKKRYVWIEMIHCIALYASAMQISTHVSPTPIISFHGGSNDAVVIAVVSRVAILCRFFPPAPAFSPRVILSGGKETRG